MYIEDRTITSFDKHLVQSSHGERIWTLTHRHDDGGWDSNMTATIALDERGTVCVFGDFSTVTFAFGPRDPFARLLWIGSKPKLSHYLASKIQERKEHVAWDQERATRDLIEHYNDVDMPHVSAIIDECLCSEMDQAVYFDEFYELVSEHDVDCWELFDCGEGLMNAPYWAHAAIRRLCFLLELLEP